MLKHLTFLVISTILLRSLTPANSINSFNFSLEDFCFLCFPVKKNDEPLSHEKIYFADYLYYTLEVYEPGRGLRT